MLEGCNQEYIALTIKFRKEDAIYTYLHEQLEDKIADLITKETGFHGEIESDITGNTVVFGSQTTEEKNEEDKEWTTILK